MLGPDFQYYSPVETYFVDFLREPPEPTGDEPEDFVLEAPKIYEEIPRYTKLNFLSDMLDLKIDSRIFMYFHL